MYVVWTGICFYYFHPFIIAQSTYVLSNITSQFVVNCFSSVFWDKNNMILTIPSRMRQTALIIIFYKFYKNLLLITQATDKTITIIISKGGFILNAIAFSVLTCIARGFNCATSIVAHNKKSSQNDWIMVAPVRLELTTCRV